MRLPKTVPLYGVRATHSDVSTEDALTETLCVMALRSAPTTPMNICTVQVTAKHCFPPATAPMWSSNVNLVSVFPTTEFATAFQTVTMNRMNNRRSAVWFSVLPSPFGVATVRALEDTQSVME